MIAYRNANFHEMDAVEYAEFMNWVFFDGEPVIKPQSIEFSLSQADRDRSDSVPVCSFGQGEYSTPFTPAGNTGIIGRLVRLARQVFLKDKQ